MQKILPIVIVAVIVGGAAFYGGIKYNGGNGANLQANLSRQGLQQTGGVGAARRGNGGQGGGFTGGEIISKDNKSVTVKLQDGSSKIVFVSDSIQIMKSTQGSASDLTIGKQITVTGSVNTDGSITAQSVQIRQLLPANK